MNLCEKKLIRVTELCDLLVEHVCSLSALITDTCLVTFVANQSLTLLFLQSLRVSMNTTLKFCRNYFLNFPKDKCSGASRKWDFSTQLNY